MKTTRRLCGNDFDILSGDDGLTFTVMTSPEIAASGVVSVASNIVPGAVQNMTKCILNNRLDTAKKLYNALKPLFSIVTVKTQEQTPFGPVTCKARNPLAYKTLMNILGMPSGPCRPPLGKMTSKGLDVVLSKARETYERSPEILLPVEKFFNVDLNERLYNQKYWKGFHYD